MADDVLINKAAAIERAVRRVRDEYAGDDRNLTSDQKRQDAMILNLQRACESSIDAAMHLVSPALATKADIVPGLTSRNRPNRTFLREAMGKRLSNLIARLALIAPLLILYASPARTHHSWAPYDVEREVKLEGMVTEYKFANPHSYIRLQTAGEDARSAVWEIELSSAVVIRNRGWSADSIAVGDRVTIYANPSRNPNLTKALGVRLQTRDGVLWEMRTANRNALAVVAPDVGSDSLAGLWRTTTPPEVRDHFFFFEPTDWPLTESGVRAFHAFEAGDNPSKDCIAYASPFLMIIPDAKLITLGEDEIVIRTELESVERVIYLNQSSHEGVEPSVQGHSIGRWEGDVLVVDTARFAEHGMGNAQKLPSGPDKHLTERFALSPDGTRIIYSFEMTDPAYLTEPIGYELEWVYSPDFEMVRLPCDPESAQRFLDLR